MKKKLALIALGASMSAISSFAANDAVQQQFQRLSDEYFDTVYFPNQPTVGTLTGYHQYDTQLEDYSRAKIDAWIAALHSFEKRVEAMSMGKEPRHVLRRHRQWRLLPDGTEIRAARRTPALRYRA